MQDGPSRKIIPKSMLKSASDATLTNLRSTMLKSAALMSFFNEYDKDFLVEVVAEKVARELPKEEEKVASENTNDIHFIAKDSSGYFYNGEEVTAKVAGDLLSTFGVANDTRAELMLDGGILCVDDRSVTKLSSLTYISSPRIGKYDADVNSESAYVGTVVDGHNVPHRVVAIKIHSYNCESDSPRNIGPNTAKFVSHFGNSVWLIVGKNFYALQPDFNLIDYTPISRESAKAAFTPAIPAIGLTGISANYGSDFSMPFNIVGIRKEFGAYQLYDSMGECHKIEGSESAFYPLPDNRIELPSGDGNSFVPQTGENYTVATDAYGHFVLKDRELSYVNFIYRLMHDIGLDLHESTEIADSAKMHGKLKFAATKGEAKPKPSKEQVAAEKEQANLSTQQAQQGQVTGQQGFEQQQQQQQQQQLMQQTSMQAVNFDDMQDVAKMSDPTLMDAYLSGKLADVNVLGREEMMRVSDNLLNAIKSVAKLLFLIRQGKVDYINETDTAMALSKMGDVIKSVGLSVNQVS